MQKKREELRQAEQEAMMMELLDGSDSVLNPPVTKFTRKWKDKEEMAAEHYSVAPPPKRYNS